jgi:cation diffusion facilitator CzcD-associated flavoprotein CzcO
MAKSVAVVGGGAAGLASLRHLVNKPSVFNKVVAYELTSKVGGTWVYTDRVGKDEHGLPIMSSMYRNLR